MNQWHTGKLYSVETVKYLHIYVRSGACNFNKSPVFLFFFSFTPDSRKKTLKEDYGSQVFRLSQFRHKMAFVYCGFLKEPTGLMKIFLLCLSIINVCLARAGFHLVPYIETVDARWLAYVTSGGYVLILSVLVLSMIFSNEMSMSADILFSFGWNCPLSCHRNHGCYGL
ncbi:unnamed protein product [Lepeophtheirus salmonis]|uniref:(salmon louse) hypothetical protein n=1 Tax=Lepeophtheirus salmonis TaxID=72036 RepID=A0A7R8CR14_LEPSM|nr:unnamed protein product [Lepeophtheirus salmonis]CAF2898590.1 unnamed protein product [Lepeophtheirus salmonis]